MTNQKKGFIAEGTTCHSCAEIIKRQAKKVEGVKEVEFDYKTEVGSVIFDDNITDIDSVLYKIEEKGYTCYLVDENSPVKKNNNLAAWIIGVIGVLIAGYFLFTFVETINLPQIGQGMGYGLLFAVGLLTGFHCIGMCGGFVVGYTTKAAQNGMRPHTAHLMYGSGKLLSYTIIGAAFGLLGSIIAFTPQLRGVIGILAGLFLVIYGLNMLKVIPFLRTIRIKTPKSLNRFIGKESGKTNSPSVIGLLNGLMIACGPLQAIYVLAAGTGSIVEGAKMLFVFGLGTLPVMLGFGYITSIISRKATAKILKASGVIVMILGLVMINRGLALAGTGLDTKTLVASASSENLITGNTINLQDGYQIIEMDVTRNGWEPNIFVLQKDVPVKWIINGKEINGCNRAILVPKYGLTFDIQSGEQVIEFTPTESGTVPWSCWMGMISGTFIVTDDVSNVDVQKEIASAPAVKTTGSCGGGCGGGCGDGCGGGCGG